MPKINWDKGSSPEMNRLVSFWKLYILGVRRRLMYRCKSRPPLSSALQIASVVRNRCTKPSKSESTDTSI